MFQEQMSNESTKANLELLCDIEVFKSFACIILMLECVQSLSKFAQTRYAFIFVFVVIVKSCQGIFIKCIMMSKQVGMGIMTLIDFWTLHMDHCETY
jgi:hypothetical protein